MSLDTPPSSSKFNFDRLGPFFLGLIPLVIAGFWNSYISKLFGDTTGLNGYMHFHATLMSFWIVLLVVQPILIRKKMLRVHRLIGRFSYVLAPLILVSMLFLIHKGGGSRPIEEQGFVNAILGLMGLFIFGACYLIAVVNRRVAPIHARAMVATGLALLDPTLMRFLGSMFFPGGYFVTIAIILGVFLGLSIWDRKQPVGRWIFPSILLVYVVCYFLLTFQYFTNNSINLSWLDEMMKWFYSLPLT